MTDASDPFSQFINEELRDFIVIDDEMVIGEYRPAVEASFFQMLSVSGQPIYYRNLMTDQQRAIHITLMRLLNAYFNEQNVKPDDALGLTISLSWLVLLDVDETILRRPSDSL
jgi:hypothetical protein